jgi:hypothetical protein
MRSVRRRGIVDDFGPRRIAADVLAGASSADSRHSQSCRIPIAYFQSMAALRIERRFDPNKCRWMVLRAPVQGGDRSNASGRQLNREEYLAADSLQTEQWINRLYNS